MVPDEDELSTVLPLVSSITYLIYENGVLGGLARCRDDEGIEFARALQANGVAAELRQTCGTIHGFEIAENNGIVRDSIAQRIERLKIALT